MFKFFQIFLIIILNNNLNAKINNFNDNFITNNEEKNVYPWLEQISRQEKISQGCQILNQQGFNLTTQITDVATLDHLIVDHKHKLLYCYVPKVACTNWKRVLMVLSGKFDISDKKNVNVLDIPSWVVHEDNSTERLSQMSLESAKNILKEYTAFIFVRHPLERLLSAFKNKFTPNLEKPNYFQTRYGQHIVKNYRKLRQNASITGKDVKLFEFVQYLIDEGAILNEHWAPMSHLCLPCAINYSFVGHYDSLNEDARVFLQWIGADWVHFPQTRSAHTRDFLRHAFLSTSLRQLEILYNKVYKADFSLFGYTMQRVLGFDLG